MPDETTPAPQPEPTVDELKQSLADVVASNAELEGKLAETTAALKTTSDSYREADASARELDGKLKDAQADLAIANSRITSLNGDLLAAGRRVTDLERAVNATGAPDPSRPIDLAGLDPDAIAGAITEGTPLTASQVQAIRQALVVLGSLAVSSARSDRLIESYSATFDGAKAALVSGLSLVSERVYGAPVDSGYDYGESLRKRDELADQIKNAATASAVLAAVLKFAKTFL